MDYISLLKRAWYITSRYKFLWIFGLFMGGASFSSSFNGNFGNFTPKKGNNIDYIDKAQEMFFGNLAFISMIVLFFIIIFSVIIFLRVISQSSMIAGVNQIEDGVSTNLSISFKAGLKKFWKVLIIQFLFFLIIFLSLIILGLPVVLLFVYSMILRGIVLLFLALVIFMPLSIIISYTEKYALRTAILEDKKVIPSIKEGFVIFKENILHSLLISVILFAINIIITIIILSICLFYALIFGIPVIVLGIINAGVGAFGGIALVILGIMAYGALFLFVRSILNTFRSSLWTLVYRKITHM